MLNTTKKTPKLPTKAERVANRKRIEKINREWRKEQDKKLAEIDKKMSIIESSSKNRKIAIILRLAKKHGIDTTRLEQVINT